MNTGNVELSANLKNEREIGLEMKRLSKITLILFISMVFVACPCFASQSIDKVPVEFITGTEAWQAFSGGIVDSFGLAGATFGVAQAVSSEGKLANANNVIQKEKISFEELNREYSLADGRISGYTKHGLNQAIGRNGVGVSGTAILDTVKNPSKVVHQYGNLGKTYKFVSDKAVVVLNEMGEIVTTYAKGSTWTRR